MGRGKSSTEADLERVLALLKTYEGTADAAERVAQETGWSRAFVYNVARRDRRHEPWKAPGPKRKHENEPHEVLRRLRALQTPPHSSDRALADALHMLHSTFSRVAPEVRRLEAQEPHAHLFKADKHSYATIVEHLRGATRSISTLQHALTITEIRDILVQKAQDEVAVRLVFDLRWAKTRPEALEIIRTLIASGVEVKHFAGGGIDGDTVVVDYGTDHAYGVNGSATFELMSFGMYIPPGASSPTRGDDADVMLCSGVGPVGDLHSCESGTIANALLRPP